MNMTDLFLADNARIMSDKIGGFAIDVIVVDPITGNSTIAGIYNSIKQAVESGTGLTTIAEQPTIAFNKSVILDLISENELSVIPKKGQRIIVTYAGAIRNYRITEVDEDKRLNMILYFLGNA